MLKRIIVEGPDCSGKSTVVDRVKNMLHWDAKSLHHRNGDQFQRYLKEYTLSDNIVFDRSHISEIVYSQLWRGGSPFSQDEVRLLDDVVMKDGLFILVCPESSVLEERYLARNYEQQIKLEELKKSRDLFLRSVDVPHILYKASSYDELDELLKSVREVVK